MTNVHKPDWQETYDSEPDDNKPTLLGILNLANDIKVKYLKPKRIHAPRATYNEKRIASALTNNEQAIKDLQQHIDYLHQNRRKHGSLDVKAVRPKELDDEIKKARKKLQQLKARRKSLQKGLPARYKEEWQKAELVFNDLPLDDHKTFLFGLILHEYDIWKQFKGWESRFKTNYDKMTLELKKDYDEETLIMESLTGKQYPPSRLKYFNRLCHITKTLAGQPWYNREITLEAQDGKWLTRHLLNVVKRLERERAGNTYLEEALDPTAERDDKARRNRGEKVSPRVKLEHLLIDRPVQELMNNYGCQLLESERNYLIKLALQCHEHCARIFQTKATLEKINPALLIEPEINYH